MNAVTGGNRGGRGGGFGGGFGGGYGGGFGSGTVRHVDICSLAILLSTQDLDLVEGEALCEGAGLA